jgi:hypothetical protein
MCLLLGRLYQNIITMHGTLYIEFFNASKRNYRTYGDCKGNFRA